MAKQGHIDVNHALVIRATVPDADNIIEFIESETDGTIVYQNHSVEKLYVTRDKPESTDGEDEGY